MYDMSHICQAGGHHRKHKEHNGDATEREEVV